MAKQGCPEQSPWLMPYLTVKDSDRALDFYARAFGFEKRFSMQLDDGKTGHCSMAYKDTVVMFAPEGAFGCPLKAPATSGVPAPVTLYVYCEDVDALCKRAAAAGGKGAMPPANSFWGDRMFSLTDP